MPPKIIAEKHVVHMLASELVKLGFVPRYKSARGSRYLRWPDMPFELRISDHRYSGHSATQQAQVVKNFVPPASAAADIPGMALEVAVGFIARAPPIGDRRSMSGVSPDGFYVYVVFRLDGRPCYVGKGKGARWQQYSHHQRSNRHLLAINAAARAVGKELPIVKVRSNLSESEAFAIEAALISAIGREPTGPLVNLTDGGEGISGFRFSDESKEKIAAAQRGRTRSPELREQVSAKLKGRPKPLSFGLQIAAIQTGRKFTDERRANISKALRGTKKTGRGPLSDAAKENLRLKNLDKKASAQARTKMSASQRARWMERRAQS